jgi:RNA polymerase sigma factor (TIGR02999 family)
METDAAFVELMAELRVIARAARARLRPGQTLVTTALVNEAYLKLSRASSARPTDQRHFFALAARAMREILIDDVRRRQSRSEHALDSDDFMLSEFDPTQLLSVDEILKDLHAVNPRMVDVVTCRFFAGYTEDETADILGVDVRTVQRDWQRARAFVTARTA